MTDAPSPMKFYDSQKGDGTPLAGVSEVKVNVNEWMSPLDKKTIRKKPKNWRIEEAWKHLFDIFYLSKTIPNSQI